MPEPIVTLNGEALKSDLRELVGRTVEDTLNGLLEEEADDLVGAGRHGRAAEREAHRAGRCGRSLATSSGEVAIHKRRTREIRRRTRVVGTFPDGKPAPMLVAARPRCVAESEWGSRRYPDVTPLEG